jgi:alpha-maltose-1-phosphate synthase
MRTIHLLRKYNPAQWGGTETAIQRLFGGLRQHGVESVVYCPQLDEPAREDPLAADGHHIKRFHAFVPILGISPQTRRQLVSVGGNLMSFDLISTLWRERDVSIIHTHTLGRIGAIGRTVAKQRGVPLVVTIHGGVFDLPPNLKKQFNQPIAGGWEWGKLFGLLFQSHRLFNDADAILTCNVNEARLLREKHPEKRIIVQPHAVPVEIYQRDQRNAALEAYPQIGNRQMLLCIGRIDSIKNQGWLIEQMPQILREHPTALLVLAGACTDEEYGAEVRRKIDALGLHNHVLLTGGLPPNDPRLIGLLQQAEALLVPSLSETFGLVILEAWAAGTKAVSSRTSGATALVEDARNGWLFDLDSPESFHRALAQALSKSDAAREVLQRSRSEVSSQYSISAVAARMKKLYAELIEERHALRNHS